MKKIISAVFVCLFSVPSFAVWVNSNPIIQSCTEATAITNCSVKYTSVPWRVREVGTVGCSGRNTTFRCQIWSGGGSPCSGEEVWDQEAQNCVAPNNCDEKTGEDAGIVENSPTAPGYELLCYSGCAVEVSEFFQRTDNNNWVIAYRYTGQPCGPGDPLGEPDVPPGEEGPPAINPNTPSDTDGDGIPDDNDDDIDGDGIPNSEDDDKDGDGIPDVDDPSPNGPPQQQQTSSANVGLDCRQSVACSGDAIQCAQLVELHRLRCAGNLSAQHITDLVGQLEGWGDDMLSDAIDAQIEGLEDGISEFDDIASGPVSTFGEMIKGFLPQPVSCSTYVVEFPWPVGSQAFDCENFEMFKTIYGWFLSILVLIYCWHMAIQPVNR